MSTSSEAPLARPLGWLARGIGVAFFGWTLLIAFGAVSLFSAMAQGAWGVAVQPLVWGGALLAGAGAWWGSRRMAPEVLASPWALWVGLLLVVVTRGVAAWYLDGPFVSDFQEYHELAMKAAAGGPWFSDLRPMGYPLLLALGFAVFGEVHWYGEALNLVLAVATGALLYAWVRRIESPTAGALALGLFAICPAQALMVAVQGTEIPYGAAVLAAVLAFSRVTGPRPMLWAGLGGALLGLSQYIRPTSLALVPAVVAYLWLACRPFEPRRFLALAATAVASTLIVLAPVVAWNWQTHHKLTISTSTYGAWSILVGTNQANNGCWNADDARWIAQFPPAERDAHAKAEAIHRITSDPLGFAALAVRKFAFMWGAEDYGVYWTLDVKPGPDRKAPTALYLLSQLGYTLIIGLALVAMLFYAEVPASVALVLFGLATLVGVHSFLEIQSRYHFYWTPLFCGIAGVGAARWWRRRQAHS